MQILTTDQENKQQKQLKFLHVKNVHVKLKICSNSWCIAKKKFENFTLHKTVLSQRWITLWYLNPAGKYF